MGIRSSVDVWDRLGRTLPSAGGRRATCVCNPSTLSTSTEPRITWGTRGFVDGPDRCRTCLSRPAPSRRHRPGESTVSASTKPSESQEIQGCVDVDSVDTANAHFDVHLCLSICPCHDRLRNPRMRHRSSAGRCAPDASTLSTSTKPRNSNDSRGFVDAGQGFQWFLPGQEKRCASRGNSRGARQSLLRLSEFCDCAAYRVEWQIVSARSLLSAIAARKRRHTTQRPIYFHLTGQHRRCSRVISPRSKTELERDP